MKHTWTVGAALIALACAHSPANGANCADQVQLREEWPLFLYLYYGTRERVSISLLAQSGCESAVETQLKAIGASIDYQQSRIGYFLVKLPRSKLLDALGIRGLSELSPEIPFDEPAVQQTGSLSPSDTFQLPTPRVATERTANTPFFAAAEGGLEAFRRQYPTADGRGVRIAYTDAGMDMLHPATQKVRTAGGELAPKLIAIDSGGIDERWVRFGDSMQDVDGRIRAFGKVWKVPAPGSYRIAAFRQTIGISDKPVQYASDITPVHLGAALLWSDDGPRVWVDSDGDGDFSNNPALRDYDQHQELGWFGRREGTDDHRIPFALKIDRESRSAWVALISKTHDIEGVLTANTLTGGLFDGAAPQAQLIDFRLRGAGIMNSPINQLEAFARPGADLVHMSGGPGPNRVNLAAFRRAIAAHGKLYVSGYNLPGAVAVGQYVNERIMKENEQAQPPYGEGTFPPAATFLGEGIAYPLEGNINDLLAPTCSIDLRSRLTSKIATEGISPSQAGPAGYGMDCSPSGTIPYVSGVAASLMSLARQRGVRYDYQRIANALFTSARRNEGFTAAEQGRGLVDALAAWQQLELMAKVDDSATALTHFSVAIEQHGKRMPADGFQSPWLKPGTQIDQTLWLTREGGRADPRAYILSLWMDDGTYVLPEARKMFAPSQPVAVQFHARVLPGRHVTFLRLTDEASETVMQDIPLHTRAFDIPQVAGVGVEHYSASIPPLHSRYRYIDVAKDVQALRYVVRVPSAVRQLPSSIQFPGVNLPEKPPSGEPVNAEHHVGPLQTLESLVVNSNAGVQELLFGNRDVAHALDDSDGPGPDIPIEATITVSKYAVAIEPRGDRSIRVTNSKSAIEGRVEFYDASVVMTRASPTTPTGLIELARQLPSGLAQWRVAIHADPESAADAFLVNCSDATRGCSVAAQAEITSTSSLLAVEEPAAGRWMIVMRPRERSAEPAVYRLSEASLQPSDALLKNTNYASASHWRESRPQKASDAQYAAFRIASTPGEARQTEGLRIAMTPLDPSAP